MLVWRFFKKQWLVQLAIMLLLTSTIVVLALYGAYVARQEDLLSVRLQTGIEPGHLLIIQPTVVMEEPSLPPYRGLRKSPLTLVASWRREILDSSAGSVMFSILSEGSTPSLVLEPDTVAIPESLAQSLALDLGQKITVRLGKESRSLLVAEIHTRKEFGESVVTFLSGPQAGSNVFMYSELAGETRQDITRYAQRAFPDAVIEDVSTTGQLAEEIVAANYAPSTKARFELISFITIAYLSTSLLAFLERRRVLAILKAMGLKARNLVAVIAGENIIAPILACLFGAALSTGVLWWLRETGAGLSPSVSLTVASVLGIVPAVFVGIVIPARLTQLASVNQLLFERPIPLFYAQIKTLNRRYPAIEEEIARGVRFIKLDVDNGEFFGFIFRQMGDSVKEGEVLAVINDWAGLRVREYVAPITGVIVRLQEQTGFIGIVPEEKLRIGGNV